MNQPFNIDTERIVSRLDSYRTELLAHPFLRAAHDGAIPLPILREFASYQYADSVLWIPMLALMRAKAARSACLQQAIEKNIACEAGLGGTSHVVLAANLMRSLDPEGAWTRRPEHFTFTTDEWLSDEFAALSEPAVAGRLLVAESLVPLLFARLQPCFERVPGCDVAYFREHVHIDEAEHAEWMVQSVEDVLRIYGPASGTQEVLRGMETAWQETLRVPTRLHERLREVA